MKEYQQLLADIDICEARDTGVNTARERFREFAQIAADKVKERLLLANAGSGDFGPHELLFAAGARCECGAGLAYPEDIGMYGAWHCSAILMGQARAGKPHIRLTTHSIYTA